MANDSSMMDLPQEAPTGGNMLGASAPPDPLDSLMSQHSQLASAGQMLEKVREGIGTLLKKADLVTPEDVVKEAGRLVAAGLQPASMAALLSEMPQKGADIASWLAQHEQDLTQREVQLEQVMGQVKHQMGAEALRQIIAQGGPQEPVMPNTGPMVQAPSAAAPQSPSLLALGGPSNG